MNNPSSIAVFDRDLIRLRRDRVASTVAEFDFLLTDVADRLMDRLSLIKKEFPIVLDLGGYHGVLAEKLKQQKGIEHVFTTDLSHDLLSRGAKDNVSIVADEEHLPFKENTLDAVCSNLSLQWVNDLPGTLVQVKHALKPDGLFMAALVGGESLYELRDSLMTAEMAVTGGASPRVSPFIDMRDMGALMQRAGFALPVVDSDTIVVDYRHPLTLMRDLRGMAASNATFNRLTTPTRKSVIMEAAKIYQEKFANAQGYISATFHIIYAIGWKPHASQQKPLKPGSATVRLADSLGTSEIRVDEKAKP